MSGRYRAHHSRSPIRENSSSRPPAAAAASRENWRLRQERPSSRDDRFGSRYSRRNRYSNDRRSSYDRRSPPPSSNSRERRRSDSDTAVTATRQRRHWDEDKQLGGDSNDPVASREEQQFDNGFNAQADSERTGRGRFDRGGRGYSNKTPRRRSMEVEKDPKPIVLNPTDVPRANRYFTHDDRLGHSSHVSSTRRSRIDSTPSKWGHDMFDKLNADDEGAEEGTPPPEDGIQEEQKTMKSVASKVTLPDTITTENISSDVVGFETEGDTFLSQ